MDLLQRKAELEKTFEDCKVEIQNREQQVLQIQEEIRTILADMNKLQGQYMLVEELLAAEEPTDATE